MKNGKEVDIMKSKVLSILLTTILVSSLVVGCGKSNSSSSSSSDSNVIYGQVTSVSDESITIKVSSRTTISKPGELN